MLNNRNMGSREDKVQTFLHYERVSFMLLAIFTLYGQTGTTDYQALCCASKNAELQLFGFFLGFFLEQVAITQVTFLSVCNLCEC